jgi:response regulator RpfG family c-di-GMP phosphodiesterase
MNNKIQNKDSKTEIIIVEDSPTQAEQLKYLLEKHNFVVLTADNGEDALTIDTATQTGCGYQRYRYAANGWI